MTTRKDKGGEGVRFAKSAILMFLALRTGDAVSLAAGMWFVPRYVSPEDIGAVLPVTSFATFLSLPVFALAMAVMKESAVLAANGSAGARSRFSAACSSRLARRLRLCFSSRRPPCRGIST